jgi:hypothetical protein
MFCEKLFVMCFVSMIGHHRFKALALGKAADASHPGGVCGLPAQKERKNYTRSDE